MSNQRTNDIMSGRLVPYGHPSCGHSAADLFDVGETYMCASCVGAEKEAPVSCDCEGNCDVCGPFPKGADLRGAEMAENETATGVKGADLSPTVEEIRARPEPEIPEGYVKASDGARVMVNYPDGTTEHLTADDVWERVKRLMVLEVKNAALLGEVDNLNGANEALHEIAAEVFKAGIHALDGPLDAVQELVGELIERRAEVVRLQTRLKQVAEERDEWQRKYR